MAVLLESRLKKKLGWHGTKYVLVPDLTCSQYVALIAAEFMCSFMFVFLICSMLVPYAPGGLLPVAVGVGGSVIVILVSFVHISSNITPVVTIAAVVMGRTPIVLLPVIFLSQMAGGFAGYGILLAVTPKKYWYTTKLGGGKIGLGSPILAPEIHPLEALLAEFLASGFLTLVCCGIWDHKNHLYHDSVPVKFGLCVTGLAMAVGHVSGCNLNPNRSFPPAVIWGNLENHWVWWIGPILGSLVFSCIYALFFQSPASEGKTDGE